MTDPTTTGPRPSPEPAGATLRPEHPAPGVSTHPSPFHARSVAPAGVAGRAVEPCPTCSGPIRETVAMVCQTCGTNYAQDTAILAALPAAAPDERTFEDQQFRGGLTSAEWHATGGRGFVVSEEAVIEFMHRRNEFDYDQCDHGTYTGGPSHGQPYAMCERQGRALVDFLAARPASVVSGESRVEWGVRYERHLNPEQVFLVPAEQNARLLAEDPDARIHVMRREVRFTGWTEAPALGLTVADEGTDWKAHARDTLAFLNDEPGAEDRLRERAGLPPVADEGRAGA